MQGACKDNAYRTLLVYSWNVSRDHILKHEA